MNTIRLIGEARSCDENRLFDDVARRTVQPLVARRHQVRIFRALIETMPKDDQGALATKSK
jgi:hypothetical protein